MSTECENWQDWWRIIYYYLGLHVMFPAHFPLHDNFWGYSHGIRGREYREPFPEALLALGPGPPKNDVMAVIAGGSGDTDEWLCRRANYIRKEIGAAEYPMRPGH